MGQKKKLSKLGIAERSRNSSDLYLGCFTHREASEPDYEGSFQIVVEAASPDNAVHSFKKLLRQLRDGSSLFEQPTVIYLESIIQLCGSFKSGLLVNYESGPAEGITARIACAIPDQDEHAARAYEWQADDSEDEDTVEPFLDFGGRAAFKARIASNSQAPLSKTSESEWERAREEKASKEKEEAEKRKAVLSATLAELEGRSPPPSKKAQVASAQKPRKRRRTPAK